MTIYRTGETREVDVLAYRELIALGRPRTLSAGDVLVDQGELSDIVFLVTDGSLTATVATLGVESVVGRCGVGDLIGEVAALVGMRRSATLRADGPTGVVAIDAGSFADWLATHPDQADLIAATARRRLNSVQVAEMAIDVLGEAAAELVPHILDVAEWFDVEAGATLFAEGDHPDAAYFVLSGRLQATRRDAAGVPQVIGDIGRGEVVGELAVIQRIPRTATIRALRDSSLARFPLADFEQLLVSHPALMLLVLRRMVARVTGATAPTGTARSVAVVAVGDVDTGALIGAMMTALEPIGAPSTVSSEIVDSVLGHDGIAQSSATDLGDARLSQYLYELETGHDHLVYLADRTPTPWSRRVIQRADTVVVVCAARPSSDEQRAITEFVNACTDTRVPRWLVMVDEASSIRPTPGASLAIRSAFDEVHHVRRDNQADLARLARLSVGAGYGLVLGGGGARGFAHLGVIKAMRDLGVPIDRIGGASMGSIFAAGVAMHDDMDHVVALCAKQFNRLLDYTVPVVSLLKAKRITAKLTEVLGGFDAEDLWIPFYCVSTNLTRSRVEVHRNGDLVTAVRASIAIPGVLPPVPYGEDLLVDGGVLNNIPADIMRADRSIGTVIAVDVAPPTGPGTSEDYGHYLSGWQALRRFARHTTASPYPGVVSVLVRTMITGSEGRRAAMRADGTVDLYLEIEMDGVGLLQFDKMTPVIERGYASAHPRIEQWLAVRNDVATPSVEGARR